MLIFTDIKIFCAGVSWLRRCSEAVSYFTIHYNMYLANAVMRRIAICRLLAKGSWEWLWPLWRPTSVMQTYTRWGRWGERTHRSLRASFKAFRPLVFRIGTSCCVLQCSEIISGTKIWINPRIRTLTYRWAQRGVVTCIWRGNMKERYIFACKRENINFLPQSYEFGTSKVTVFRDVDLTSRSMIGK